MIILALLVVALALLVFGLVESSGALLIASLAVSVIAGLFLFRLRAVKAGERPMSSQGTPAHAETPAAAPAPDDPQVWVIDGRPRYHRRDCEILDPDGEAVPRSQAVEDGFIACSLCQPELDRAV